MNLPSAASLVPREPGFQVPFARELETAYLPSVDKIEAAVRKVLSYR